MIDVQPLRSPSSVSSNAAASSALELHPVSVDELPAGDELLAQLSEHALSDVFALDGASSAGGDVFGNPLELDALLGAHDHNPAATTAVGGGSSSSQPLDVDASFLGLDDQSIEDLFNVTQGSSSA